MLGWALCIVSARGVSSDLPAKPVFDPPGMPGSEEAVPSPFNVSGQYEDSATL
jgi:hypothetical protein